MLCKYPEREGLYLDTSIVYLNGMSSILVLLDVLKLNIYIYIQWVSYYRVQRGHD